MHKVSLTGLLWLLVVCVAWSGHRSLKFLVALGSDEA
jgi:hypothetical protein